MIEFMDESQGELLGIRATGKLRSEDYRDVLIPRISMLLREFRSLRVLFLMDEAFAGWSLGAAWANTVLDVNHRRDFAKVAIVGAPKWEQWCVHRAAVLLMAGDLRTFPLDELDGAWDWVRV